MDQQNQILKVSTFNIRNTQDRYHERKNYLKDTLLSTKADIMGLQEVAFGENGQLDELIQNEGNFLYNFYLAESQLKFHNIHLIDKEQRIDGNAIIVNKQLKYHIESHEILHISHVRVAQKLLISLENFSEKILFVNTHLHHTVTEGLIRYHQSEGILNWIKNDSLVYQVIIVGDFNFTPNSNEYKLFEQNGYQSTYKYINKEEPEKTFPTGLTGPFMDVDDPGTFDYIWFKGNKIIPKNIQLFGTEQLPNHEGIYPSDHYGLLSEFSLLK